MNGKISKIQLMGDGLRFRRKRKFQDIDNMTYNNQPWEEENIQEKQLTAIQEEEKSRKSKKMKQSKNKENVNLPKRINEDYIKPETAQVNSYNNIMPNKKESNKNNTKLVQNENFKEIDIKISNSNVSSISDNKKAYLKEVENVKDKVRDYDEYLFKELFPLMGQKLKACCINNSRALKDFKCNNN